MAQVVDMILDRLVSHLTTVMITNVNDETKASIVKKGLLQTDKVGKGIQIGVTGGDHEDPQYTDGIATLEKMPNIAFKFDAREVGGGQMWWRRGVARIEVFMVRERKTEDQAHSKAYQILGRLEKGIATVNLGQCIDEFDEHAIQMFCFGNTFFESGGPPTQYIFRGKVLWQCLTERP